MSVPEPNRGPKPLDERYGQTREDGWVVIFDEENPEDRWLAIDEGYPCGQP